MIFARQFKNICTKNMYKHPVKVSITSRQNLNVAYTSPATTVVA